MVFVRRRGGGLLLPRATVVTVQPGDDDDDDSNNKGGLVPLLSIECIDYFFLAFAKNDTIVTGRARERPDGVQRSLDGMLVRLFLVFLLWCERV